MVMTRRTCVLGLCLVMASMQAMAGSCEDSFEAEGDPRNGLFFTAQVQVPGLAAHSALGQLRQLVVDGGYETGGELLGEGAGEFSFIQRSSRPPLVVRAAADDAGLVTLALKLAGGQKAQPADVMAEFCGLLAKLRPGAEGLAIAAAARARTGAMSVVVADAVKLSAELGKEMDAVMGPVRRKGTLGRIVIGAGTPATQAEYAEAFAPVRAKYLGRRYRVDGQVHTLSQDRMSREMSMAWLVTPTRGLLGIRQEASFNDLNFQLKCVFADDQSRFFATLAEGNQVTLQGVVTEVTPGSLQLSECRRADR
jgi:hypothetical protein